MNAFAYKAGELLESFQVYLFQNMMNHHTASRYVCLSLFWPDHLGATRLAVYSLAHGSVLYVSITVAIVEVNDFSIGHYYSRRR